MTEQPQNAPAPGGNFSPPAISLPKGGGAIRGIGEKFAANPVTGTGSFTLPVNTSPARSSFGPQINLTYDSGSGNSPFGFGWSLSVPAITRKTDKGLPRYEDLKDLDEFLLSGSEDLVPLLEWDGAQWQRHAASRLLGGVNWQVERYRPRVEGPFARIERWTGPAAGDVFWRSITRENVTTLYGRDPAARIADPADPARIYSWLACESYDDRGNAMLYQYLAEELAGGRSGAHRGRPARAALAQRQPLP